jgi:hypothetical protein
MYVALCVQFVYGNEERTLPMSLLISAIWSGLSDSMGMALSMKVLLVNAFASPWSPAAGLSEDVLCAVSDGGAVRRKSYWPDIARGCLGLSSCHRSRYGGKTRV